MIRAASAIGAVIAAVAIPAVASAQLDDRFSVDVSGSAGYSNNPFASAGGDTGSALLSLDIIPRYEVLTARSAFSVTGDASLQQYLRRYSRNDNYSAAVDYTLRPSAQVTAHTHLDLSSAVIGSYGSFVPGFVSTGQSGTTTGTGTTGSTTTASGTSAVTTPPFTDIGLFGLRNRRRLARLSGDLSVAMSANDTLTISGYTEAARYRQLPLGQYEAYSGSVGYSRRISEQTTIGLRASASAYDYRTSNSDSRVFPIEATLSSRLNALWTIDGSLGATFVDSDSIGSTNRTSVSGTVNLCRRGQLSFMCASASRQVLPTGLVGSQYVTAAGLNWGKQLGERENLSLNVNYSKVGGGDAQLVVAGLPLQTEYGQAVAGYDRQISQRLRFVASANYRRLLNGNAGRSSDYGGQLGLSYRIGDVR